MFKKLTGFLLFFTVTALILSGCSLLHDDGKLSAKNIEAIRNKVWDKYIDAMSKDAQRKSEFEKKEMQYGNATMRYTMVTIGDAPEGGYPLYIALHGGGGVPMEVHEEQWKSMMSYYLGSVKNGVYVVPRGIRPAYNTHSLDESYPLYDRLIQNMITFANVNPNRVYLMGFSAGGDGVYQIAPRMADRFAAADMSAGHPNGVSLKNIRNLPLVIQVGEMDTAYNRNLEAVKYDTYLSDLSKAEGGYYHETFMHFNKPHNFRDNDPWRNEQVVIADLKAWMNDNNRSTAKANTNAVDWVSNFERNPYPGNIVWDLSTRAVSRSINSFYWLRLNDPKESQGEIKARLEIETNSVIIDSATLKGGFTILLNEKMLNIFKPVYVKIGGKNFKVNVKPNEKYLEETTFERGDRNYQFAACIVLNQKNNEWRVSKQ